METKNEAAAIAPKNSRMDVLAILSDAATELQKARGQGVADDVRRARAAVAELVAAVKENRDATQRFANDGKPENWLLYVASEKRLTAALAAFEVKS